MMELGGLFDDDHDREISEDAILLFMEMMVQWNQMYLKKHPGMPRLYDSGVVYKRPEQLAGRVRYEDETQDLNAFRRGEHFRDIPAVLDNNGGDCFPLSQKIIARSCSTGMYELISIGDLRFVYPAYEALSYNFSTCRQEFKPIIGFVDKGVKPVSMAHLSNGTDLIATDDHRFWTLDGSGINRRRLNIRTMGEYVEAMGMSHQRRSARSRILQASRIPALDMARPSQSEAYLAGIYAAEGNFDGKHTCIAQHKPYVRAKIEMALADVGTSFRYRSGHGKTPGSGAYYALHGGAANPIIAMMRDQGFNSFDKRLPQALLSGDEDTVSRMIEGHGDGDAWRPANGSYKRPNVDAIYATSSDELMEQLRLGLLVLGRPSYAYRYENHQGKGSRPIWRLHEYNNNAVKFRAREEITKDELPGLRYGTVRNAKPFGTAHVGCLEVEGNHNFFLADGTLVSNCDNLVMWRTAELRNDGCRGVRPYITNRVNDDGSRTYHALVYWPSPKPKGSTEDPSLLLGMGGSVMNAAREAEKKKNSERAEGRGTAIMKALSLGIVSPAAVRAAVIKRRHGK